MGRIVPYDKFKVIFIPTLNHTSTWCSIRPAQNRCGSYFLCFLSNCTTNVEIYENHECNRRTCIEQRVHFQYLSFYGWRSNFLHSIVATCCLRLIMRLRYENFSLSYWLTFDNLKPEVSPPVSCSTEVAFDPRNFFY